MAKRFSAFLLVLLLCTLAVPAFADIAYEPEDSFYRRHSGDCTYENRSYYTNGADGYVLVYSSPSGSADYVLPNGLGFWIYYTYDGEWGQLEYDPDDPDGGNWKNFVTGWVKMSEMTPDYDNSAFFTEHGSEYVPKDAELDIAFQDTVYTYKYPGSGIVLDELHGDWARDPLTFSTVFIDPAGREWGHMNYYYGRRNCWVCIDDPHNGALEPDENFRMVQTVPAASAEVMAAALKGATAPNLYLYAGAAGVVVIAAAVLVFVLRRRTRA